MADNDGEEKLSYLLQSTYSYLPESYVKLKSYLNIHSSHIAAKHQLTLPKFLTNKNISCPFCLTQWKNSASTFKLCPSNGKKFHSLAFNNSKKSETQGPLQTRNKLVLKCKVCLRKSNFSLMKPIKSKIEFEDKDNNVSTQEGRKKKKKKRNKKCANLNVKACLNAGHSFKIKKRKKEKKQSVYSTSTKNTNDLRKSEAPKSFSNLGSAIRNPYAIQDRSMIDSDRLRENNKELQRGGKKVKDSFLNTTFQENSNSLGSKKTNKKTINHLNALKKAIKEDKKQEKCSFKDFLYVIG